MIVRDHDLLFYPRFLERCNDAFGLPTWGSTSSAHCCRAVCWGSSLLGCFDQIIVPDAMRSQIRGTGNGNILLASDDLGNSNILLLRMLPHTHQEIISKGCASNLSVSNWRPWQSASERMDMAKCLRSVKLTLRFSGISTMELAGFDAMASD